MGDLIANAISATAPYIDQSKYKVRIFRPAWHDKILHFRLMPVVENGNLSPLVVDERVLSKFGLNSPLLQLSMQERISILGNWIKVFNCISFSDNNNNVLQIPITDVRRSDDEDYARASPAFALYRFCKANSIVDGNGQKQPAYGARIGYMAVVSGIVIFDGSRPINPPFGLEASHEWPLIIMFRSSATAFLDHLLMTPFRSSYMLDPESPLYVTIAKASYFNKSASSDNKYLASFSPSPLVAVPWLANMDQQILTVYFSKIGSLDDVIRPRTHEEQIADICSSNIFDPATLAVALHSFELPKWVTEKAAKDPNPTPVFFTSSAKPQQQQQQQSSPFPFQPFGTPQAPTGFPPSNPMPHAQQHGFMPGFSPSAPAMPQPQVQSNQTGEDDFDEEPPFSAEMVDPKLAEMQKFFQQQVAPDAQAPSQPTVPSNPPAQQAAADPKMDHLKSVLQKLQSNIRKAN